MYTFFNKWILGLPQQVKERGAHPEKPQDLLVWHGRSLPANALTYDQLVAQWIAAAKKQTDATRDSAVLRERLRLALATEWPDRILSERQGEHIILSRAGQADRVAAIRIGSQVPSIVVVDPDGAEAARKSPVVENLIRAGKSVLLVTAFQTGYAVAPRNRSEQHFLTFNRSDDANRVQDILTALAYLKQQGATDLRVIGLGKASVWVLFAAAVAPFPVALDGKPQDFGGQDQDFLDKFFVPG